MARKPSLRSVAVLLAAGMLALGAGSADAPAATLKIHSKKEHGGVYLFSVKRLRSSRMVRAEMRVGGVKRRISVNRVRRAARAGLFRARAPRKLLMRVSSARRRKPRTATLLVTSTTTSTTTGTTSTQGSGSSGTPTTSTVNDTPMPVTCNAPFSAGNWPGACWRPYADSSPFNQRIPDNPRLAANSAAMVQRILGFGLPGKLSGGKSDATDDYGHPTYYPTASDPLFTLHCTESWGRCAVEGLQVRIPNAAKPASGSDGHMTVVDQASGWEYDFWQVTSKPAGGGTLAMSWGGRTRIDGDGLHSDATAAQFGNLAGIIRAPELMSGQIDHALFVSIKCDSGSYVYPASKSGRSCADAGLPGTNAPPMGTRLQLAMSDDQIAALPLPQWKKGILTAMAHYGMYFGDTGGPGFGLQVESPATYTSFGVADPIMTWAQGGAPGVTMWNGDWVLDIASGVDWARYLRVVDSCVAQGNC